MKSIRLRLLLGAVLGVTIALVIAGAILVSVFEGHIRQRYIKELDDHLLQLAAAVEVDPSGAVTLRHELSDPAFQRPLSGLYWQVADAGHIVLRSRSLWDEALAATSVQFAPGVLQESETKGPRAQTLVRVERVVLAGAGSGRPLLLTVAGERGVIDEARRDITRIVSLSLAILAVLLAAASWVQVGAGLAPLQRLRAQLNNLRQGKAARLEGHHPVELSGLVDDLNGLIAVQAHEVERARANASKLGHGLKTPLAILAAEARELREKGEVAAATAIEHEVETMNARVAQTLASVRAVGPRKAIGTRTVLEPFLQRLVDTMKRLPRGDRHQWSVSVIPRDAALSIDRRDLEDLFGNLLDNARKWARSRVEVVAKQKDGTIQIAIEDDGPGIEADRVDDVLSGGARLDRSVPGTGIGLAVAKDLAELHGARLDLGRSTCGGLRAVIQFPTAGSSVGSSGDNVASEKAEAYPLILRSHASP